MRTLLVCNLLPWEILRRLNESSCPSPPSATRPRRGRTNDLARAATLDAQLQPHLGLTPRTLRPHSLSPARPHMQGGRSQHSCTHRDLIELIRPQPRVWHRTPGPIVSYPTCRRQGLYYTTAFSLPGLSEGFILRVVLLNSLVYSWCLSLGLGCPVRVRWQPRGKPGFGPRSTSRGVGSEPFFPVLYTVSVSWSFE